jgi:hypothetical protein
MKTANAKTVIPAKAGIHTALPESHAQHGFRPSPE